jgi:hypothetical protein
VLVHLHCLPVAVLPDEEPVVEGGEERRPAALRGEVGWEDRELEVTPVLHVGEPEVLDGDLVRVADQESRRRALGVVRSGVHHPVEEVPVLGAPALLPALVGRARAAGGEEQVHLARGQLAEVPRLDVLQVDGEPGVGSPHPGDERRQDAAEATDRLVGDAVVHVHQADVEGVHTGRMKYVTGCDSRHENRADGTGG